MAVESMATEWASVRWMCEQRENEDEYYAYRRAGGVVSWRTSALAIQRQLGLSPQRWAGFPLRGLGASDPDGPDGAVGHCKAVMGVRARSEVGLCW
jgi:hypothetical protein